MKINYNFPTPGVCLGYTILILITCAILGCEDSPSTPTNLTEETIIEEDTSPKTQQAADTSSVDNTEATPPVDSTEVVSPVDGSFVVFDGTRFRNKPEMTQYGFTPVEVIYSGRIWENHPDQGPWELPDKDLVSKWARRGREVNELVILNVEHWPIKDSEETVRQRSMESYMQVYDMFKQAQPGIKIGYYDTVPRKNWFASVSQRILDRWRSHNDFLTPLAQKVDALFPSLYTYEKDQQYWVKSARMQLQESRRISGDKPVYAFLWPQYYATRHPELKDEYIDADFWRLQLETARRYADGVVIWFPYRTDWEAAVQGPWWEVTKEFLQQLEEGFEAISV